MLKKILPLYRFLKTQLQIFELKRSTKKTPLKIVIASDGVPVEKGWASTDIHFLNLLHNKDWQRFFKPNTIDNIFAEHVWEHLTIVDGAIALQNCYTYLKQVGRIRIAVPDGFHPSPEYIAYVKIGGSGWGADDHKVLYNYQILQNQLEVIGFKVELIEYFNEAHIFCENKWSVEDGKVWRSKNFDERNKDGKLNYTSLIIDGIKPYVYNNDDNTTL